MRKTLILVALVLFAALTRCSAVQNGFPEPVIPQCLGVNIHFLGDNEKEIKQLADAGFRFIRMDFLWNVVEKEKGKYDFTEYDGLMTALDRHGIRPLFILDYGNPLYPNSEPLIGDEARKGFAAFAEASAAHFKDRGVLWEIWNEPNLRAFPATDYAKLVLAAGEAIHRADPNATVVGPTSANVDMGYIDTVLKAGGLSQLGGITVHPYRGPSSPPESAAPEYAAAYELIRRYTPAGRTIPLLSGEWGYTMVGMSAEQQAQYLVRMFLSNLANNVNLSIWYDWHDDGEDPNYGEHHFGTVYFDFTPKPAYYAMQMLSKQLAGYRFAQRIYTGSPDDYVLIFKNGRQRKLAAWTIGSAHEIDLPMDVSTIVLADMYGKRRPGRVEDGSLKLQISQDVTYVDVLGSSRYLAIEEAWSVTAGALLPSSAGQLPVHYTLTDSLDTAVKGIISFSDPSEPNPLASRHIRLSPNSELSDSCELATAWKGGRPLAILAELRVDGLDKPMRRLLSIDTSKMLTALATAPAGDATAVYLQNPSGDAFAGSVKVNGSTAVPFSMAKGQTFSSVGFDTGDRPTASVEVLDKKGRLVYASGPLSYKQTAAFDNGSNVSVVPDGNGGVALTTNQTTAAVPEKLEGVSSCVKVDYSFGSGWRFARFNSNPLPAIEGEPRFIGIWVYGDGSNDGMSLRLADATGQIFQPGIPKLDFKGWRFVTWPVNAQLSGHWGGAGDGVIHWPVHWDTEFILDSMQTEHSGTIYLGPIWLVY